MYVCMCVCENEVYVCMRACVCVCDIEVCVSEREVARETDWTNIIHMK